MAYRADNRRDRWKAMLAAILVTGILGFGILTGLNVRIVSQAVERLQAIDINLPKPPPPQPPPRERPKPAKTRAGAPAAPRASPIVAPKPEVQLPAKQVIAAAAQAGTGASSSNGQGGAGAGTGSGGTGTGLGSGAGFTPARKITKIPDREYRRLAAVSGVERGSVGIAIRVTPDGQATDCRVIRSSGSPSADALMCQLTEQYVRFRPALDPQGRPVAQDINWYPNWWRP
jgi:protein TonB